MDLEFPWLKSSKDMINTINKVIDIFKEVASAWEQCPGVTDSEEDHIKKVSSVLQLFANPTTHDLYKISLGALDNWESLNAEMVAGYEELVQGNCGEAGMKHGLIMKKVIESDVSLAKLVWGGLGKAVDAVVETFDETVDLIAEKSGKVFDKIGDWWDEL